MSFNMNTHRVQSILNQYEIGFSLIEFPQSTHTSKQAAQVIGCELAQIAKSLIFKGKVSGKPILVITSGINRVDEEKIKGYIGEGVEKADAEYVLRNTGFVIGGVPPVGHLTTVKTLIDEDLVNYKELWAAAGTPYTVFRLAPCDLLKITKGEIARVK